MNARTYLKVFKMSQAAMVNRTTNYLGMLFNAFLEYIGHFLG